MLVSVFVFILILALPFVFYELRCSRQMLFSYWFVIALHQVVAVINAFFFTTIGADADATTFHRIGMELAQSGDFYFAIGASFYRNLLGVIYYLFGGSHFLGEQLSILAFALSCVVVVKILGQLDLLRHQALMLLVFGALPTMVLLGSITMRESYQVLFFMLAVYFGIKMHSQGGINKGFIALILSAFIMGLFHNGLILYMLFLVILFMVFSLKPSSSLWHVKKLRVLLLMMLPILFLGLLLVVKLEVSGLGALSALSNMDIGEYASNYRSHSVMARATYGVALDLSSPFSFIYSAVPLYFYYLFSPFPWQVGSIVDVYAVLESIMRMVLIYYSIKHWRNASGMQRRLVGLMLVLFFSMSFLWAMGTTNYGTAMRHHMLTWWILVILGVPPLIEALRRFIFRGGDQSTLLSPGEKINDERCAAPCVVTDVGDAAYIVGNSGLVVSASNSEALANAMMTMIEMSDLKRSKIGEMARERVVALFSMESVVKQYEKLYRGVS